MDDLISRRAAIDAPFKKFDASTGVTWIPLEHIEQLPSAQPEIIRCKDCKHFWLGQCGLNGLTWSYDSFCSRAERQE